MYSLSKLLFLLFLTLLNFNLTLQRVREYTYNFEYEAREFHLFTIYGYV